MQTSKFFFNVYFDPSDIIKEDVFFEHLSDLSKFQKSIEKYKYYLMKKRVTLIITYCYPPYSSPESYITYKLLNSLSSFCDITGFKEPSYNNLKPQN